MQVRSQTFALALVLARRAAVTVAAIASRIVGRRHREVCRRFRVGWLLVLWVAWVAALLCLFGVEGESL